MKMLRRAGRRIITLILMVNLLATNTPVVAAE